MKIWGYTQEKEMVEVELSLEKIAAAGIDPWRLDLFDPDPLSLDLDGKRIYFRRVQDLCFAIKASDTEVKVGFHDGETAVSLSGEPFDLQQRSLRLRGVKVHPTGFTALYQEFLQLVSQETPSDWPRVPPRYVFEEKPYMEPLTASAVKLHGDSLEIRDWNSLKNFAFVGEMFKEVQTCVHLPAQVAWLFQEFGQWDLTVRFDLESMLGWPVEEVEFTVDEEGEKEIRRRFCKGDTSKFTANRCTYSVLTRGSFAEFATRDWSTDDLSVFDAYSRKPSELLCSRIGLYDLAKRQARLLNRVFYSPDRELSLMLRGFGMLDGPWEASRGDWLTYRLLKAARPAVSLVYRFVKKVGRLAGGVRGICSHGEHRSAVRCYR